MLNQLIICLTNNDLGSREDCNVFYSDYYLVTSDALSFKETLFNEKIIQKTSRANWLEAVRALGYSVPEIKQRTICFDY